MCPENSGKIEIGLVEVQLKSYLSKDNIVKLLREMSEKTDEFRK